MLLNTNIIIYLLLIFSTLNTRAFAGQEIILEKNWNPNEITENHLNKFAMKSQYTSILESIINEVSGKPNKEDIKANRIEFLTPKEAQNIYQNYATEYLDFIHVKNVDEMLPKIFSKKYFGFADDELNPDNKLVGPLLSTTNGYVEAIVACLPRVNFVKNVDMFSLFTADEVRDFMKKYDTRQEKLTDKVATDNLYDKHQNRISNIQSTRPCNLYKRNLEADLLNPDLWGIKNADKFLGETIFGFLGTPDIRQIIRDSRNLINQTNNKDTFIIFGNTPYFIGRAMKMLGSNDPQDTNYRNIIFIPFSGTPNRAVRPNILFGKIEERDVHGRAVSSLSEIDLTSPDRIKHLETHMKTLGISPSNESLGRGTIYLIDVIGSGAGPAFFLGELIKMYQHQNKPIPKMEIVTLNKINPRKENRHKNIADTKNKRLYFPSLSDPKFSISYREFSETENQYSGKLDFIQDYQRYWPPYNAAYWNSEYDYLKEAYPNSRFMKLFLQYFDHKFNYVRDQGL